MSKRKRGGGTGAADRSRWKFSMICANNINRSMEGHKVLYDAGLRVNSYGAGRHVRIPHETQGALTKDFGEMVYADVLKELRAENEPLYVRLLQCCCCCLLACLLACCGWAAVAAAAAAPRACAASAAAVPVPPARLACPPPRVLHRY